MTREFQTYAIDQASSPQPSELVEVFRNGVLTKEWTLAEVRARSTLD
jgi:hypothetical protein